MPCCSYKAGDFVSSPMCFQRTRSNTLLQMHSPLDWVRVHATDACALVWHVRVTCMHRERTRANQVAQAKAFASRMVDEGRLHASPNRAEFRQDSVMWVSARCTRTYALVYNACVRVHPRSAEECARRKHGHRACRRMRLHPCAGRQKQTRARRRR